MQGSSRYLDLQNLIARNEAHRSRNELIDGILKLTSTKLTFNNLIKCLLKITILTEKEFH